MQPSGSAIDATAARRYNGPRDQRRIPMGVTWESSYESGLAKAKETGRLAMVWFHSPH